MKQFLAFVRKEFYHIFRDSRTMLILLVMPVVLIILFGYAITNELRNAPITIFDQTRDETTGRMTDRLIASEYFTLYKMADNYEEVEVMFRKNKIKMAVIFPPQFTGTDNAQIQLLIDASDPNEATMLNQYVSSILATSVLQENINLSPVSQPGIEPIISLLYNPLLKSSYNFVPGVMGLILMLICALMTSVGIVKEKEMGTMEVLLVSPLKPVYIIIAKGTPYLLLSMVNIATILILSRFLLEVPVVGSIFLLILLSILYAIVALCLGLLISTVSDSQQSAMLISGMALMLPIILLSDMIFPIDSMPNILQWLSVIIPAKYYISAVRDIMIKGVGLEVVWKDMLILIVMSLVLIQISLKRFKIRLE